MSGRRAKPKPAPKTAAEKAAEQKVADEMRRRAASRERAMLAHHASMALSRDLHVALAVPGEGTVEGWVVAITNDHTPQADQFAGPSNLMVHLSSEDSAKIRAERGHVPASVVTASRRIPLEVVQGLRRVGR